MEFLILEFRTTATGYNVVAVRGIHNTVRRDDTRRGREALRYFS
jgi:hypothetical protein